MSRSRKKYPVVKDGGWMKGLYNRKFRRVNRQRIKMGKRPYLMRELINPYDVCDWRFQYMDGYNANRWWRQSDEDYFEWMNKILRK